ncbi:MAG TPA: hypothetical protein ENK10_02320 [Acidobacteria bacterium]|nr:hypothetical protein [Acidobacteriota bacterium]
MSDERLRFEGRDITEAVAAARRHFGVARHDLGYEVIRKAGVGEVAEPGAAMVEIEAWKQPGARPRPEPPTDDGYGRGRRERRDRPERRPRREERQAEPFEQPPLLADPEVSDVRQILEKLVNALVIGLDLRLYVEEIVENGVGLRVRMSGGDVPLLLEEQAEGLESFQYLANRILHRDGRIPGRVSFDAGDYRARQEQALLEQARSAAEEVIRSGQTHKMPPMGPYERRLIHLALSEMEGVRTYSTGSGYRRRLHIAPRSKEGGEES